MDVESGDEEKPLRSSCGMEVVVVVAKDVKVVEKTRTRMIFVK